MRNSREVNTNQSKMQGTPDTKEKLVEKGIICDDSKLPRA